MFNQHNTARGPFDPRFRFDGGFQGGFGRGRERLMRGHLNMIILEIIKERPRHGYDVIKAIEEKFHGFYTPSAGSVYPILQELEDQDFVTSLQEGGKKIYSITSQGEKELKENKEKFAHMHQDLHERFGDTGRFHDLMSEIKQTMEFTFGKMREKGINDPATIKKLRLAIVNFKTEVEDILSEQKKSE